MSAPHDATSTYSLETGTADQQRLVLLNHYYNPGSLRFLRAVEAGTYTRVLDVGCGQGQMAHLIAGELGAGATVVGVDASEAQLEVARTTDPRPGTCRWVCARADQLTELEGPFDLVYARFLLQHLHDPIGALRAMRDVLAPGGLLVVEDALTEALRYVPMRPSVEGAREWYFQLCERNGSSPRFPEQLPIAARALGLTLERFESYQPVSFERGAMQMHLLGSQQIYHAAVAAGIATADEVRRQLAVMQQAHDDPETYIELYRVLQIAARKPA